MDNEIEDIVVHTLNLQRVCRVCLLESDRMYSIFSELFEQNSEEEGPCIYEMLISISSIKIQLNDGLPSMICTKCIDSTHGAFNFQKQCNKSQEILDNYVLQLESLTSNDATDVAIVSEEFLSLNDNDLVDSVDIPDEYSLKDETILKTEPTEGTNDRDDELLCSKIICDESMFDAIDSNETDNSNLINSLTEKTVTSLEENKINDRSLSESNIKYYSKELDNGEKVYKCNLCYKTYKYASSLNTHFRNHSEERPYKCDTCGKDFKHLQSLIYHQRSHTGEQPYACKICGKRYKQSGTLTAHMRVHTGARPFLCSICGKGFRQSPDLTYHMRTHTKEKPYMCNVCGKTMSMQCHLVQHMRTHTGEKPFKCLICHKAFPSSTRLKRHEIIHTGLKPYTCDVCDKSFNRKSTLFVHSKIHTDERPHVCPICGKGFIQGHAMRLHISTHQVPLKKFEIKAE